MLDEVERILSSTPILTSPILNEPLLLYIAAMTQVVSATLMVEREEEGHALKFRLQNSVPVDPQDSLRGDGSETQATPLL